MSIENSPPLHEISSLEDITEAFHYEHIEDTICTIDTKNVISTEEIIANTWSENVNEQHDNDDHVETSNSTESSTEHTDRFTSCTWLKHWFAYIGDKLTLIWTMIV